MTTANLEPGSRQPCKLNCQAKLRAGGELVVAKWTPEQEAAYALDYGSSRSSLSKPAQLVYDRLLRERQERTQASRVTSGGQRWAEPQPGRDLNGDRSQSVQSSAEQRDEGGDRLGQLVDAFLRNCANGNLGGALDTAQEIFMATPRDNPNARMTRPGDVQNLLERPWKWMRVVADQTVQHKDPALAAKIGLMCQVWNRMILPQEPRYQAGRLVQAPLDTELGLYRSALAALVVMPPAHVLVPGGDGWSVREALEQISRNVILLIDEGVQVDEELRGLAAGDPKTLAAVRGVTGTRSGPAPDRLDEAMMRVGDAIQQAKQGDEASEAYLRGGGILMNGGDEREALRFFEQAARLGHVPAMFDAGTTASKLGDKNAARYWWEAAANGGDARAAWNIAAEDTQVGRADEAMTWYLKAAELGETDGYAALTQMAVDAGDAAEELRWARAGAEAGHSFCMLRYGLLTLKDQSNNPQAVQSVLPYLERVGAQGDSEGMFLAGLGHSMVGNRYEARHWLLRAEEAGEPRARAALNQAGL